jgi:homoserine kinase type II
MAVYTPVSDAQAQTLLDTLGLGPLRGLKAIASGIENTNYFVDTDGECWVLTLFERLGADELPFYLSLMQHLAARGLPVPAPRADGAGRLLHQVAGKPAALVQRLSGVAVSAPDLAHCQAAGQVSAQLHLAAADAPLRQPNLRGPAWREATAAIVRPWLDAAQQALLDEELAHQRQVLASATHAGLPSGPVHADMFRDNVLFDGPADAPVLTGVFDFYFAGDDTWAFDLAVTINDWCVDPQGGRLDEARADALVAAYAQARLAGGRPVAGAEWRTLAALRRMAALRFWLSRLADWHQPREARLLTPKDPQQIERILRDAVERPWHPAA